jgi:hypothetical protein
MREKIARYTNQISDLTVRKAVQQIAELIVDDLENHKAQFDSHTHTALDTAPVAGQHFQDPHLKG